MITQSKIQQLVETALEESDVYLVEVHVGQGSSITVYLDSDKGVTIDDCVKVSRYVEHQFDREVEDFELLVTSAGLDQPFKIKRQYIKNIGKEVDIVTKAGLRQKGILTKVNEEDVELVWKVKEKIEGSKKKEWIDKSLIISFEQIKTAKIVISF